MEVIIQPGAASDIAAIDRRRRIIAIVAGSSGNLVEWYDFYVYSFLALYFAPSFFPSSDRTAQLSSAAGIFAAGFLMRPLGGWLLGRIADKRGRRASMMISVLMMCGGSLMIAILPTYAEIGTFAPLLLLAARLFQGLSVGGEYGASATYMSEVAIGGQRGFYASFWYVTIIGGQLLAVLVLVVLQAVLTNDQLHAWGWRVPFLIGAMAAVVALFLRRSLTETTTAEARGRKEAGSLTAVLRRHPRAFATVVCLTAGGSLSFYVFTTYMQKYLVNTAGMDSRVASSVMTLVLIVYMLMQPAFGALADRIGNKSALIAFGVLAVVCTRPLLMAIGAVTRPATAFVLIAAALTIVSLYSSISGVVKADLFPTEVRAMGVGLSFAIANVLFGGTAEYVALWFKSIGSEGSFAWYVTALCAVALGAAIAMPNMRTRGYLDGTGTIEALRQSALK
jgi:MHS family alpha-ketoglutarate permease-like MFS transporter